MMTQFGTLVYSASDELDIGIVIIFIWMRKQFRTCSKTEPKLILPLYGYCQYGNTKGNVASHAECSVPEACCSRKKGYWCSA